ncbi:hypothetical protein [Anaerovibrio sp.]|uniref:hypothetical protein n=1 Tax=Anaerovibrio sp. TaxID=1872532 RepID=UPI003F14BE71
MMRHVKKWLWSGRWVACALLLAVGWLVVLPSDAEAAEKHAAITVNAGDIAVDAGDTAPTAENVSPDGIVRQRVGIVLLGNPRYLQPEYLDILNRYFIRCYSQYRYPTEYGASMQQNFADAYEKACGQRDIAGSDAEEKVSAGRDKKDRQGISEQELPALITAMDKEQVLFLRVNDILLSSWRRSSWDWGADVYWEATVEVEALLADRSGVLRREKVMRRAGEKYTPSSALQEAYTYCIRYLQQKEFFTQAAK